MKKIISSAAMFLCCIATPFAQFSGLGSGTVSGPCVINRLMSFMLICLCSLTALAADFTVDNINYNITSTEKMTVEVTSGISYEGDIVISDKVEWNGNEYSVTSIGDGAFNGCSGLTSVTIPNSVIAIGRAAFMDCSSLISITIPNSVVNIGSWAFNNCNSLSSLTIPNSVSRMEDDIFYGCSGLVSIIVEEGNTVYDSRDNSNAIIGTKSNNLILGCKNTRIPNTVTSIGDGAFAGCRGLTSITIPNSVTSIGIGAFANCSGLASISIPNSVMSIESYVFQGCSGLNSIIVEDGNTVFDSRENSNAIIKTESNELLYGCMNTIIPNSVTSIGNSAFRGSGLTSVTIPNSVTSIGGSAFSDCGGLTEVVSLITEPFPTSAWTDISTGEIPLYVPVGTKELYQATSGWKGFIIHEWGQGFTVDGINYNITSTEESTVEVTNGISYEGDVVIPDKVEWNGNEYSVTSIGENAFGDRGLTSITIPNSVTSIGSYAFAGSGLTSITIPNSVTSIGDHAFDHCSGLTEVVSLITEPFPINQNVWYMVDVPLYVPIGTKELYQALDNWKRLAIYEWGREFPVGGFDYNIISMDEMTVEITRGRGWHYEGDIVIPERVEWNGIDFSVVGIGKGTFSCCSKMTSVSIPNTVTYIEEIAFIDCYALTSINIPNSVTSIGSYAFQGCTNLNSISIPNSVTTIRDHAFYGCNGLTTITIPNSVTSIGHDAFNYCSSLSSVIIPNSVKSIEFQTFWGCSSLTSITIPNSVRSIGFNAFMDCSSLNSITIPNSVTSIESGVFSGCSGLTSMIVEDGNTVYDSRDNSNAIIETEKNELIYGCKNTIIPNTVTGIGDNAFSRCSGLTSITIPNSVTNIGRYAFGECSGLTEVISLVSEPFPTSTTQSVWYGVNTSEIPLYVPVGTKELYEATEGWNVFANIIERGISVAGDDGGVDFANNPDIDQDTDLNGNVVGNIFYNISDGNGEYSSAEGCIILRKTTSDEQVDNMVGLDLFGEDVKNNYTGIIFMVQQGSGTVKVNAETTGNMTLKVKVGHGQPVEMVFSGKLEVTVPYAVSEPSYVYIYGGEKPTANARGTTANTSTDNVLKIYGIEWSKQDISTIMNPVCEKEFISTPVYNLNGQLIKKGNDNSNLPRGIYIVNGKKVVVK